jgi:hypothetical protein
MLLPEEEKLNHYEDASQHATLPYDHHIKQTIIGLRLPGEFDCSSIQLSVAHHDLQS